MTLSDKRWKIRALENEQLVAKLSHSLNDIPVSLARALLLRGVNTFDEAREYFRSGTDQLHDPFLMTDMEQAVERVIDAINRDEKIVVYGDYDVDGTTSTALLTHYLGKMGASVGFFVPDRFKHGYGLSQEGLDEVRADDAEVVIALDCGVTAVAEAVYARSLGMDLIICDHHTPKENLPDAVAVLDSKRDDCCYPFKELCGCGVTLKFAQAIHQKLGHDPLELNHYLDLVAVATASDMVSLKGENRILLREGLQSLREHPRMGLKMLAEQAGIRLSDCSTRSIVFSLGPRINAAGRLGDAARAVTLLLAEDELEAVARARQLERLNDERRLLDRKTQEEAFAKADLVLAAGQRHALVLHDASWHLGVIGIVASRLVERHYRPAIMLSTSGSVIKGSARSINGINIYRALEQCQDLLEEFGGHDFAAGLSLKEENLAEFTRRFEEAVAASVTEDILDPVVDVDAEMSLSELDGRFWAILKQFEPFGQDNPSPVFIARNLDVVGPVATVGKTRTHLKFSVRERKGTHPVRKVIGFGLGKHLDLVSQTQAEGTSLDMVFSIEENTWNGRTSLQLQLKDLCSSQ